MPEIKIIISDGIKLRNKYLFERLEDELAELLESFGLSGTIEDSITGNTTTFPIVKEEKDNE